MAKDDKRDAKTDAPADDPALEAVQTSELTDKDLDQAAGGGWPYVTTGTSYYKPI